MENQNPEKQFGSSQSNKETLALQLEDIQPNLQYYHYFKALQEDSHLIYQYLLTEQNRRKALFARIQELADKANGFKGYTKYDKQQKKKIARRGFNQIHKKYNCPFPKCNLSYATQSSYRVHLKIKHPHMQVCQMKSTRGNLQSNYK